MQSPPQFPDSILNFNLIEIVSLIASRKPSVKADCMLQVYSTDTSFPAGNAISPYPEFEEPVEALSKLLQHSDKSSEPQKYM